MKPVVVKFVGDDAAFQRTTEGVTKRLGEFGKRTEHEGRRARKGFDQAAEGADNAEGKAQGFASTLTGTKDTMLGVGQIAKGNLFEGFVMVGQGAADLAEGFSYTVIPALQGVTKAFTKDGIATVKDTASKVAHTVATKASTVATWGMTLAQRALNLAMRANPIGLVITGLVLLAVAVVTAYRRSETFRNIVQSVWRAVKGSVLAAVDFIVKALRGWLNVSFSVVQGILKVMGKLPGPMGAPFRAAEKAVTSARETISAQMDRIQGKINSLRGKKVVTEASARVTLFQKTKAALNALGIKGYGTKFLARGGLVREGTGPTADDVAAWVSRGEAVVPAKDVSDPWFMAWAREKRIPGFGAGGLVGGAVRFGGLSIEQSVSVMGATLGRTLASTLLGPRSHAPALGGLRTRGALSVPALQVLVGQEQGEGGWLPPGLTMAYNGGGSPARVLGPDEGGVLHVHFHGAVYADNRSIGRIVREELKSQATREGNRELARIMR